MSVENCGNCAFGVSEQMHNYVRLSCHRRAPRAFEQCTGSSGGRETYGPRTHWPIVDKSDFCGEFELKDAQ